MQRIIKCPKCGKLNTLVKAGHQTRAGIGQIQQWRCKARGCGRTITNPIIIIKEDG